MCTFHETHWQYTEKKGNKSINKSDGDRKGYGESKWSRMRDKID